MQASLGIWEFLVENERLEIKNFSNSGDSPLENLHRRISSLLRWIFLILALFDFQTPSRFLLFTALKPLRSSAKSMDLLPVRMVRVWVEPEAGSGRRRQERCVSPADRNTRRILQICPITISSYLFIISPLFHHLFWSFFTLHHYHSFEH